MPGAKPFPSQIRIGVDIAHVPRFKNLISRHIDGLRPSNAKDQHDPDGVKSWSLRRWGKRVISQLEWARFDFLVSQLEPATTTSEDKVHVDNVASWLAGRYGYLSSPPLHQVLYVADSGHLAIQVGCQGGCHQGSSPPSSFHESDLYPWQKTRAWPVYAH